MFEIISVDEQEKWQQALVKQEKRDIYFSPGYLKSCSYIMDGAPYLAVYSPAPDEYVVYPFLKRRINDFKSFIDLQGDWFDLVSPYGYSGVLSNTSPENTKTFFTEFNTYCAEHQIVSEFVRFHPILQTQEFAGLNTKLEIEHWNDTVIVDLGRTIEEVERDYKDMNRRNIKKAIKNGLQYQIHDNNLTTMELFNDIYIETMQRVESSDFYLFPMSYYECLLQDLRDNLLIASINTVEGVPIAMGIFFIYDNQYVHYHLGGSRNDALNLRPNNLMFASTIRWAHEHGYRYLHLGGGTGKNDSLFNFKAMFSHLHKPFYIGRVIHNAEKYNELVKMRPELGDVAEIGFFPAYRA